MGYHLEVTRRAIAAELTRCEWRLHRQLATHLTRTMLVDWQPTILANIERLRNAARGQPHTRNLSRWEQSVSDGDLVALRRALTAWTAIPSRCASDADGWASLGSRAHRGAPQWGLMRRDQLEPAVRTACQLTRQTKSWWLALEVGLTTSALPDG